MAGAVLGSFLLAKKNITPRNDFSSINMGALVFTAVCLEDLSTENLTMLLKYTGVCELFPNAPVYQLSLAQCDTLKASATAAPVKAWFDSLTDVQKGEIIGGLAAAMPLTDLLLADARAASRILLAYKRAHQKMDNSLVALSLMVFGRGSIISRARLDKITKALDVGVFPDYVVINKVIESFRGITDDQRVGALALLWKYKDLPGFECLEWLIPQCAFPNQSHLILISQFLSLRVFTGFAGWSVLLPQSEIISLTNAYDRVEQAGDYKNYDKPVVTRSEVATLFQIAQSMINYLSPGSTWVQYKGKNPQSFIEVEQFMAAYIDLKAKIGNNRGLGLIIATLNEPVSQNVQGQYVKDATGQIQVTMEELAVLDNRRKTEGIWGLLINGATNLVTHLAQPPQGTESVLAGFDNVEIPHYHCLDGNARAAMNTLYPPGRMM